MIMIIMIIVIVIIHVVVIKRQRLTAAFMVDASVTFVNLASSSCQSHGLACAAASFMVDTSANTASSSSSSVACLVLQPVSWWMPALL
jgi:hypothetical protein